MKNAAHIAVRERSMKRKKVANSSLGVTRRVRPLRFSLGAQNPSK